MRIAAARLFLALAICAPSVSALSRKFRLYNNETGEKIESAFKFRFSSTAGTASAIVEGVKIAGEYSISQGGGFGWGAIYSARGSSSAPGVAVGAGKGALIMVGPGLVLQCEFITNAVTTHGNGQCKDNRGAFYSLIF